MLLLLLVYCDGVGEERDWVNFILGGGGGGAFDEW